MPLKPNLKADLAALALLAASLFLAIALATYDPADPLGSEPAGEDWGWRLDPAVFPPNLGVHNFCGRAGALTAHLLLASVGFGAYLLLATLVVVTARLLKRQPITEPGLRAVGWLVSLAAFDSLLTLVTPTLTQGPVIGPGGYLGAIGATLLHQHFAATGAYLLAGSLFVAGLLAWSDYVVFRWLWAAVRWPFVGLLEKAAAARSAAAAQPTAVKKKPLERLRDDLEDAPLVRVTPKQTDVDPPRPMTPAAELEDDEEDEDGVPPVPVRVPAAKTPPVRVETPKGPAAVAPSQASAARDLRVAAPATASGAAVAAAPVEAKAAAKAEKEALRQEVSQQMAPEGTAPIDRGYELPGIDLLLEGKPVSYEAHEKDVRQKAKILEATFANFGYHVKVVEIDTGPVIAQFEVELEAGLRLSKITGLADDLAIALRVPSVRIVAPIPGKNTVGIEVPNAERQLVRMRSVMEDGTAKAKKMHIPIFLGQDVSGKPLVADLTSMPHLLIAGRTGTGKSVCLNTLIVSMLMTRRPDEVKLLLIDPKMVELSGYRTLPHLMHPVVTDMKKAEAILAWAVDKMEERYALLARAGVRHVTVYNQLGEEELRRRLQPENEEQWQQIPKHLPFIVIVADEMADLMMQCGKEVEQHIIRLAQKSRAVGIHLVLATQKPTVDVITGLIKSNLPARIAFQVASRTDSRVVLDEMGADKLLGNGDFLFLWPGTSTLVRGQGTYISDDEINSVVSVVGTTEPQYVQELVALKPKNEDGDPASALRKNRDDMYEPAIDVVVREGRGSVSLLQRSLGIGYGRAARLIDFMAEDGIVGEYNGAQAREVLITVDQWEAMRGQAEEAPPEKPAKGGRGGAASERAERASPAEPKESREPKVNVRGGGKPKTPPALKLPPVNVLTPVRDLDDDDDDEQAEEGEFAGVEFIEDDALDQPLGKMSSAAAQAPWEDAEEEDAEEADEEGYDDGEFGDEEEDDGDDGWQGSSRQSSA